MERRDIPPGGSIPLKMTVNVPVGYINMDLSCTVTTIPPIEDQSSFHLIFENFPEFMVQPSRLDFGSIPWNNLKERKIDARLEIYGSKARLKRSRLISTESDTRLIVDYSGAAKLESVNSMIARYVYPVKITLKPNAQAGMHSSGINLILENGARASTVATWFVRSPIEIVPSTIHFGTITNNVKTIEKSVLIKSLDNKRFIIKDILFDDVNHCVSLKPNSLTKNSSLSSLHTLSFVFHDTESSSDSFMSGMIRIIFSDPDFPEVQIPWSAFSKIDASSSSAVSTSIRRRQ